MIKTELGAIKMFKRQKVQALIRRHAECADQSMFFLSLYRVSHWECVRIRANWGKFAFFFFNFGKKCVAFSKFHEEELNFWYLK